MSKRSADIAYCDLRTRHCRSVRGAHFPLHDPQSDPKGRGAEYSRGLPSRSCGGHQSGQAGERKARPADATRTPADRRHRGIFIGASRLRPVLYNSRPAGRTPDADGQRGERVLAVPRGDLSFSALPRAVSGLARRNRDGPPLSHRQRVLFPFQTRHRRPDVYGVARGGPDAARLVVRRQVRARQDQGARAVARRGSRPACSLQGGVSLYRFRFYPSAVRDGSSRTFSANAGKTGMATLRSDLCRDRSGHVRDDRTVGRPQRHHLRQSANRRGNRRNGAWHEDAADGAHPARAALSV